MLRVAYYVCFINHVRFVDKRSSTIRVRNNSYSTQQAVHVSAVSRTSPQVRGSTAQSDLSGAQEPQNYEVPVPSNLSGSDGDEIQH